MSPPRNLKFRTGGRGFSQHPPGSRRRHTTSKFFKLANRPFAAVFGGCLFSCAAIREGRGGDQIGDINPNRRHRNTEVARRGEEGEEKRQFASLQVQIAPKREKGEKSFRA